MRSAISSRASSTNAGEVHSGLDGYGIRLCA
jgi:hypothetical protein